MAEIEANCRNLGFGSQPRVQKSISKRSVVHVRNTVHSSYSRDFMHEQSMEENMYKTIADYLFNECLEEAISELTGWSPESDSSSIKPNVFGIERVPSQTDWHGYETVKYTLHGGMTTSTETNETEPLLSSESSDSTLVPVVQPKENDMETHFIEVGSLTYGGIFGLGEKMTHRVIMARTNVQCLQLPRYWLMEEDQNPGHIWQRRRFYLENCIPSREELFANFLKTRRWNKFKEDFIQSTLNPNSVNSTHPEDIPIMSRIVETRDEN